MKFNYGVMQGRLSKKIGNKIQAFPEKNWKIEFSKAKSLGLKSIEWTLDYKNLKNCNWVALERQEDKARSKADDKDEIVKKLRIFFNRR